jgi:hypothetical protein
MDNNDKQKIMGILFRDYTPDHRKYTSIYKGVPVQLINENKKFIDFTRFYIMYRGPRRGRGNTILKQDAVRADIYEYRPRDIIAKRQERIQYNNYVRRGLSIVKFMER